MAAAGEGGVWDQDCPPGNRSSAASIFVKRATTTSSKQTNNARKVVRDDWDDDEDDEEAEDPDVKHAADASGPNATTTTVNTKPDGVAPGPNLSDRRQGGTMERKRGQEDQEDSGRIWEEANRKAPMPQLIVAPASTSQGLPPPPPAAFQPTLRILRRPSPSPNNSATNITNTPSASFTSPGTASGSGSGGASPAPRGTLAEREAQYLEARSRIFGEEKEKAGGTDAISISRAGSISSGAIVVRDPLGPSTSEPELQGEGKTHGWMQDRPAKGFGERRRGKQ